MKKEQQANFYNHIFTMLSYQQEKQQRHRLKCYFMLPISSLAMGCKTHAHLQKHCQKCLLKK